MNTPQRGNFPGPRARSAWHEADPEAHPAEPGLAVVEVAAAEDQTAFASQVLLAGRWATASADRTTRVPGEPGVRLRCFLDLRQLPAV
ncbi:DUF6207 family protein [Streptomyces coeruleorubidus]|uniref:DUF6207 family protein n=1 Tax=Streptomyces coeruleorubidus TaxID=116188 RepID=UPI0037B93492